MKIIILFLVSSTVDAVFYVSMELVNLPHFHAVSMDDYVGKC